MQMTENEIVKSYNEAMSKSKQIGILAELNDCKVEDIVDILKKNGVEVSAYINQKAKSNVTTSTPKKADTDWKDALHRITGRIAELEKIKLQCDAEIAEIKRKVKEIYEEISD